MRLHKLLARQGVASLRASERLIAEGRVRVNGVVVNAPGAVAEPEDDIRVDGRLVTASPTLRYFLLNKPRGVVSTASDEMGRETVLDLLPTRERVYPVGRLDRDSEGLMLLTNDGSLAERLMHPRYGAHKQYRVEVEGGISEQQLARLRAGVQLEDGLSRPLETKLLHRTTERSTLLLTLGEGRNRQVRRTLEALGLRVLSLVRLRLGPLDLRGLQSGRTRELSAQEVRDLRQAVGLSPDGDSH
ncbi:MAG: rRNA pseudouridine synthase [Chloroflexota bacterium]|nr:rRNA pseudouridine synthase [Chloroflexota bacterium]